MTICFLAKDGKVAFWEKPLSGSIFAPFDDPVNNMDLVRFHSDFQYLSNAIITSPTINHTSLAGATGTGYTVSNASGTAGSSAPIMDGQIRSTSITLHTHSLGYVPYYFVLYNDGIITSNAVVQTEGNDRVRFVSTYATTSIIGLQELACSSASALSSASRTYKVIIFKEPVADPLEPVFYVGLDRVVFGQGKVTSDQAIIRKTAPGEDDYQFYIPLDRLADINNGSINSIDPNGKPTVYGPYDGGLVNSPEIFVGY